MSINWASELACGGAGAAGRVSEIEISGISRHFRAFFAYKQDNELLIVLSASAALEGNSDGRCLPREGPAGPGRCSAPAILKGG
jgi:hypothetical protein